MQIFQHSDVDLFKWGILGKSRQVLTLRKNISLGLRLLSLQLYGSYKENLKLHHMNPLTYVTE